MWSYLLVCFSKSPRRFLLIFFFPVYFTAMHLFGLNWQLQELDNQQAFENGGTGKTGSTQSSIVTALAADGEKQEPAFCSAASSLFGRWLPRCWSHFIFILWFGVKSLNQKKKVDSVTWSTLSFSVNNPECCFVSKLERWRQQTVDPVL